MADNKEYLMISEENGKVLISEDVINSIAAAAAMEVDGVDSVSPYLGKEIAEKLGMKNISKGIHLTVNDNNLTLECCLVINYGYDVVEIAKNVQTAIANAVSSMTGFNVERVDVTVSGVSLTKKK